MLGVSNWGLEGVTNLQFKVPKQMSLAYGKDRVGKKRKVRKNGRFLLLGIFLNPGSSREISYGVKAKGDDKKRYVSSLRFYVISFSFYDQKDDQQSCVPISRNICDDNCLNLNLSTRFVYIMLSAQTEFSSQQCSLAPSCVF